MQLDSLKPKSPRKPARRVGRGGKRGKTAGRGGKGQTARAGSRIRPEMRDIIKRLPKRRGYGKNRARTVFAKRPRPVEVSLSTINERFESGAIVSPATLAEKGLVERKRGILPAVKILGSAEVSKKLTVEKCLVTAGAKAALEKTGGSVVMAEVEKK